MTKARDMTAPTSMPMKRAARGSSETARTAKPKRVRCNSQWSQTVMTTAHANITTFSSLKKNGPNSTGPAVTRGGNG